MPTARRRRRRRAAMQRGGEQACRLQREKEQALAAAEKERSDAEREWESKLVDYRERRKRPCCCREGAVQAVGELAAC